MTEAFKEALRAVDRIRLLLDGVEMAILVDSAAETLTFDKYVVHISDTSVRVTGGLDLLHSSNDPRKAVIEAVASMLADQTREFLYGELLENE